MALRPTRVDLGLDLNGDAYLLAGTGAPGTTAITNEAAIGSRYSDISTGEYFLKIAAGSGTDKWMRMATEDFVSTQLANLVSWREPVEVNDSVTTVIPTGTPGNPITVDGESIGDGERVLFSALTGGDGKNVYIYDQPTGTFIEDTNLETEGDTTYVVRGTDAGKNLTYNGTDWVTSNQASLDELGFIRAFIGKNGIGSETPNYGTPVVVTQGVSLEAAIIELDTAIGSQTYTEQNQVTDGETVTASLDAIDQHLGSGSFTEDNVVTDGADITDNIDAIDIAIGDLQNLSVTNNFAGVTTTTVVDTIPLTDLNYGQWYIAAENAADSTNIMGLAIHCTHNGVTVDYGRNDRVRIGAQITGLDVTAAVVGANLEISVLSTTAVDVGVTRVGFVAAN